MGLILVTARLAGHDMTVRHVLSSRFAAFPQTITEPALGDDAIGLQLLARDPCLRQLP